MIIVNRGGLTEAQEQKIRQPYARNSGDAINFQEAAKAAQHFFEQNPGLIKETGELLNEVAK